MQAASEENHILDELIARDEDFEKETEQLKLQLQNAYDEIHRKTASETNLKDEMRDLEGKITHLESKEVEYRGIILGNAGTQGLSDQDVIQVFSDLRQKVQQLVSSSAFDLEKIPVLSPDSKGQKRNSFYYNCRLLQKKDVINRFKSQIFALLYQYIFGKPLLGLKGDDGGSKEERDLWQMESGLARFEKHLLMAKGEFL